MELFQRLPAVTLLPDTNPTLSACRSTRRKTRPAVGAQCRRTSCHRVPISNKQDRHGFRLFTARLFLTDAPLLFRPVEPERAAVGCQAPVLPSGGGGGGADLKIEVGKHKQPDSPATTPPLHFTVKEKRFFTHRFDSNSARQKRSEERDRSPSSSAKTRVGVVVGGGGGGKRGHSTQLTGERQKWTRRRARHSCSAQRLHQRATELRGPEAGGWRS